MGVGVSVERRWRWWTSNPGVEEWMDDVRGEVLDEARGTLPRPTSKRRPNVHRHSKGCPPFPPLRLNTFPKLRSTRAMARS
eukprot:scaffold431_cov334-Pavlova_lutheri.AAC.111